MNGGYTIFSASSRAVPSGLARILFASLLPVTDSFKNHPKWDESAAIASTNEKTAIFTGGSWVLGRNTAVQSARLGVAIILGTRGREVLWQSKLKWWR